MAISWPYVAGYFDGEGHVGHHVSARGTKTTVLIWYNTHLDSLLAIQSFIGAGHIHARKARGLGSKPQFQLNVARKADLLRVCDELAPHLIIKRDAVITLRNYVAVNVDDKRSANHGLIARIPDAQLRQWRHAEGKTYREIALLIGARESSVRQSMLRRGLCEAVP